MGVHFCGVYPRGVHGSGTDSRVSTNGGVPHHVIPGRARRAVLRVGVAGQLGGGAAAQGGVAAATPERGILYHGLLLPGGHELGLGQGPACRYYLQVQVAVHRVQVSGGGQVGRGPAVKVEK